MTWNRRESSKLNVGSGCLFLGSKCRLCSDGLLNRHVDFVDCDEVSVGALAPEKRKLTAISALLGIVYALLYPSC